MGNNIRVRWMAAGAALALTLAACGSDEESDSTTATTAAAATTTAGSATTTAGGATTTAGGGAATTTATGGGGSGALPRASGDQTATVYVIADVTQGPIAYTSGETYPAVQAAFAEFPNVTVKVCDAKGDANEYLNCQRKAVDDNAVAAVIGFVAGGASGEDVLYQAGIPALGSVATVEPLAYGVASGTGGYYGLGAASAASGCTDIGILHLDGTDFLADAIEVSAASQGAKVVSRAPVASNAPDLAPAIAKLLGDGAKCIVLSVTPPMVVQGMTAISQSGETPKVAAVGAILPPQIIQALGPLAEGVIAIEGALNAGSDAPVLGELKEAMTTFDPKAQITIQSTLGFVAGHALATAVSQVTGDVTAASVVTQLNTLKDVDMGGITPPFTVQELKNPTLKRYMNPWAIAYEVKGGKLVAITGDFVDLKPAIDG